MDTYDLQRFRGGVALDTVASAPATPAAGQVQLYAKTDGGLYVKNEKGAESSLTPVRDNCLTLAKLLTETCDPESCNVAGPTVASGRMALLKLLWPKTLTFSKYWIYVHTAGAGLTTALLALYTSAGALISGTTSGSLTTTLTATGVASPSITAVSVPADPNGWVYAALLQAGTTPAILRAPVAGAAMANIGLAASDGYRYATDSATGLSAMPANLSAFSGQTANAPAYLALGA